MQVPEAAFAALGEERAVAVALEVGDQFARLPLADDRAHRHAQGDVLGALAVLVAVAAVLAVLGAVLPREAEVDQRVDVAVRDGPDAAAAPAVAAARAAARDELLPAERGNAVAALACV